MPLQLVTILGLLLGLALSTAGIFYLVKEQNRKAKKVYLTVLIIGIVILTGSIIKALISG